VAPNDDLFDDDPAQEDVPDWLSEGDLDSDDAIAWLEEIAAKYDPNFETASSESEGGSKQEAEEVSPRQEPAEEALPDWLTQETPPRPVSAPVEPARAAVPSSGIGGEEDLPSWLKDTTTAGIPSAEPEGDEMEWLDRQVLAQGVGLDEPLAESLTPDSPPVALPAVPPPDAEAEELSEEELPDWLKESAAREAIAEALEVGGIEVEAETEDDLTWLESALEKETEPASLEDLFGEPPQLEKAGEAAEEKEEELPDWLKGVEEQPTLAWHTLESETTEATPGGTGPLPPVEPPAFELEEEEELPDWLKAAERVEEAEDRLPDWLKGGALIEERAEEKIPPEPVHEEAEEKAVVEVEEAELIEEAAAALPELAEGKAEPEAEVIEPEPVVPSWAGVEEGEVEEVEPVAEAEEAVLESVEEPEAVSVPGLTDWLTGAVEEPAAQVEPEEEPAELALQPVSGVTIPDDVHDQLSMAREKLSAKAYGEALVYYEHLVAHETFLEQTVADLDYALKTGARVGPQLQRVLGDALRAQGRLQEALDAYRAALDQL
jgi:tetratricopeptide (TPR) repeat protein